MGEGGGSAATRRTLTAAARASAGAADRRAVHVGAGRPAPRRPAVGGASRGVVGGGGSDWQVHTPSHVSGISFWAGVFANSSSCMISTGFGVAPQLADHELLTVKYIRIASIPPLFSRV